MSRRPAWWSSSLMVLVGLEPSQVRRIAEPVDGPPQALVPGQPGLAIRCARGASSRRRPAASPRTPSGAAAARPRRCRPRAPISVAMSSASFPMAMSSPGPQLNTSPSTAEAGASPRSMKACTVSVTYEKSRVGSSAPSLSSRVAGRELGDDLRDDGAGRLPRAERVERPQRH